MFMIYIFVLCNYSCRCPYLLVLQVEVWTTALEKPHIPHQKGRYAHVILHMHNQLHAFASVSVQVLLVFGVSVCLGFQYV